MSKPSSTVTWATDTNYASGPESGQSTRLEPGSGVKAQGFIPTEEAPARWANWLLGRLGDWSVYLNNLPNETDFTGEAFDWGGAHSFADYVTIESGGTLQVDGDAFFNGDITFSGWTDDLRIGDEILYANSVGASPAPRARQVLVPLSDGQCAGNVGGTAPAILSATGPAFWSWPTTSGTVSFPLRMPRGAKVGNIRVGCSNQAGGSASMSCDLLVTLPDKTTPSTSGSASLGTGGASVSIPSLGEQIFTIAVTPGAFTVDNSIQEYRLVVTGQVGCRIHWVELNYLDPGPRNG